MLPAPSIVFPTKSGSPVLPSIRTFRNTDVAALCKVWNAHYGDLGADCQITTLQMELSSLAKPYFRAEELLVAEYDEQVVGFLHIGELPDASLTDSNRTEIAIDALCIVPCDGENSIAKALLSQAEKFLAGRNFARCLYKPMLPGNCFYQGFGPADSMIGATTSERRGCSWVATAGFTAMDATALWELDLSSYQPPVDRNLIQIRRSSQVLREVDEPNLPWWQSCLLGHTEPTYFELSRRSDRARLCDALFWTVGMELQTSPLTIAWLWCPTIPTADQDVSSLLFLLAEACRQLQADRLDLVRAPALASDTRLNNLFRRLGFSAEHSGVVFQKKLS